MLVLRHVPLLALALGFAAPALAQPADLPIPAATTDTYPPGVKVLKTATGAVYANARGLVLYGMDMRTLIRWAPNPALYCVDQCAKEWEPLLAPAGTKPNIEYPRGFGGPQATVPAGFVQPQKAPDWTVIAGPSGPQWVYKGWHLVYVRKGGKPEATTWDGADKLTWNTLKFVPPVPVIAAPPSVSTAFTAGAYALTDKDGRLLFTGKCADPCAWTPLGAGMASRGVSDWTVSDKGDHPQWLFRGQPVWVSAEATAASVPAGGAVLRP